MNKISVSEALKKIESGQSIKGYSIDFDRIRIEALDVMKLAKNGVIVPDESIYYDDNDIQYDEAFEGEWTRIDYDPIEEIDSPTEIKITLRKEIKNWVDSQNIQLDKLVEDLLDNFYKTQKLISKE